MEVRNEQPGIEVHCRAIDCVYNNKPFCRIFTMGTVLIIGIGGHCVKYEENKKHEAA